jgi:hypothetical protein
MAITGSTVWGLWQRAMLTPSGQSLPQVRLAVGAPGCKPELGALLSGRCLTYRDL